MDTNLQLKPNLMLDLSEKVDKFFPLYRPELRGQNRQDLRYLPGDLIGEIYPELVDRRCIKNNLTPEQIEEYEQYLVCELCGRRCAGTCVLD